MQVVITGAGSAFGQRLLRTLVATGTLVRTDGQRRPIERIIAADSVQPGELFLDDRIEYVRGDLALPHFLARMMGTLTDSVFHLVSHEEPAPRATTMVGGEVDLSIGLEDVARMPTPTFAGLEGASIANPSLLAHKRLEHELERSLDVARMLAEACSFQQMPPRVVYFEDYPGAGAGERMSALLLGEAGRLGIVRASGVRLEQSPLVDADGAAMALLRAHDD